MKIQLSPIKLVIAIVMVFAKYLAPRAVLQYPWRWRNIDQKKAFRRSVIVLEKVKPLQ